LSPSLRVPRNEHLQEVHEWCEQRLPGIGVVESPRPVFEVALKSSTELRNPNVWCTWFWKPTPANHRVTLPQTPFGEDNRVTHVDTFSWVSVETWAH